MTYTTLPRISNPYLASLQSNAVPVAIERITSLTADEQLAALWYIYTEMGQTITPAAPGAASIQFAEGLLNRVKSASFDEQLQILRDLVNRQNSETSRAYGVLTNNTKLAFWYQLAEWMREGTVVPMAQNYQPSRVMLKAIESLRQLEMGQQLTVLRNVVSGMGIDPLA
jgi:hypothetical protein